MAFIIKDGEKETLADFDKQTTAHILTGAKAYELARLDLYRRDLEKARTCLAYHSSSDSDVENALDEACLIYLCRCFESTSGLRRQPLNENRVFSAEQRKALKRLIFLRNKLVAHDTQITGGSVVVAVLDNKSELIATRVLVLTSRYTARHPTSSLSNLVETALIWILREFDKVSAEIKAEHDQLPIETRKAAPQAAVQSVPHDLFS